MKPSTPLFAAAIMALAAMLILAGRLPSLEAAISCSDTLKDLQPCLSYLRSGSGKPPPACCVGASSLASAASSSSDKKAACSCLKQAAQRLNPKIDLAKNLPTNCKISLPFAITPNVDCNSIS